MTKNELKFLELAIIKQMKYADIAKETINNK